MLEPHERTQLRQFLVSHFDLEELQTVATDLGIDYDRLPHDTRDEFVYALIRYLERNGLIASLLDEVQRLRPRDSVVLAPIVLRLAQHPSVVTQVGQSPLPDGEELYGDPQRESWGDAPDVRVLYGRENELTELTGWIIADRCRVVALLGIGGIGKTALATALARQIGDKFEFVLWRSLRNAPPPGDIIGESIKFISHQQQINLAESVDDRITALLALMRDQRCLVVLDNIETVLSTGAQGGAFREGYEAYGTLLERAGTVPHQSCLLITSREKPAVIAALESNSTQVRSLTLKGLGPAEGQALLRDRALSGSSEAWTALISNYAGSPLALRLVSARIEEVFDGNIANFLQHGETVFGGIQQLLEQQFGRLSPLERSIMYWLAIERDRVPLDTLLADLGLPTRRGAIIDAVQSLLWRSLIERSAVGAMFSQQPVVMEYVTDQVIELVSREICDGTPDLLVSHALMKAQAKDFVRDTQTRLILQPIIDRLLDELGTRDAVAQRLVAIAELQRERPRPKQRYGGGNIVNLLVALKGSLQGYDLSGLNIWQAALQNVDVQDVNLANADLSGSMFADTFGGILALAFSPNSTRLASGGEDRTVRLWDVATRQWVATWQDHIAWVWSVAFSPDGTLLASGSEDRTVRLWDISTAACVNVLTGHTSRVRSVAFSPDGTTLASSGDDQHIILWNVDSGTRLTTLEGHTAWVWSVAFSPDGTLLASGSEDRTVRLWDISTAACVNVLTGHTGRVRSVAFSPDGTILASGSEDRTVRLWDITTGVSRAILRGHTNWIRSVAFSPDGTILASGSEDRTVRLWSVKTGVCRNTLQAHAGRVTAVAFSSDGALLASGSDDRAVKLWDPRAGQGLTTLHGHTTRLTRVIFSADGTKLASAHEDWSIRIWDVTTGQCLKTLRGHTSQVRSLAFDEQATILASGSEDATIKVWDLTSGRSLATWQGHDGWVWAVAFNPDNSILVSGSEDRSVKLWEWRSRRCIVTLAGHTGQVWSLLFSPDGTTIASRSEDRTVRIWDITSATCLHTLGKHNTWVGAVAFSRDGTAILTASPDGIIKRWDVHTGECLEVHELQMGLVEWMAFSPDGALLATTSEGPDVRLWDVQAGQCRSTLRGHSDWVGPIIFSPDGHLLASSSDDGTIRLWDVSTATWLKTLRSDRPYERTNITHITGLTDVQLDHLRALGAIEDT